jgi:hypothetical protein
MNTWTELAATLEKSITEVIDDAYPHAWNEDHLSYQLLQHIHGSLQSRPYLRGHERVRVTMECYKQTGGQERNFGDIGLLVTVAHKGAAPITGVAYLEAKRRRERTVQFPEIKVSQAERILRKAPRASFLLYDYEYSTQFVGPLGYQPWNWREQPLITDHVEALPVTKVRTVPIHTALAAQSKDTALYAYGTPLSIQLVSRYFCGLDLEFSKLCVESMAGWREKFLPKRLAVIRVVEGRGDVDAAPINSSMFAREE